MTEPQGLKFATYHLDKIETLKELEKTGQLWWKSTLSNQQTIEKLYLIVLKEAADVVALQNVSQKSTMKKVLSEVYGFVHFDLLTIAYNRNRVQFIEKRDIDLLPRVLARADTEYGVVNSLPASSLLLSLSCVNALYSLFEMIDADDAGRTIRFIVVNCDLSGTPEGSDAFRCALICEMFRLLYEDTNFSALWDTQRVVILGSFKSAPGTAPYDYLTRFTNVIEERFVAQVSRAEGDEVVHHTGFDGCAVRRFCFLVVRLARIGQLHHLTKVIIETTDFPIDRVDDWELTTLQDEQPLRGTVEISASQIIFSFKTPCSLHGAKRHFRLNWVEKRERDAPPLLDLVSPSSSEHVVHVHGISYGYDNFETGRARSFFRSAYATCPHNQTPCTTKELLAKNPQLKILTVPKCFLHPEPGTQKGPDTSKNAIVDFTTWCDHSLSSPFARPTCDEPQFTTFFPLTASSLVMECKLPKEGILTCKEFAVGTHDYILYCTSSFKCTEVGKLQSLLDVWNGGMPSVPDTMVGSHLFLSCTLQLMLHERSL
ncbi:hypothetical protein DQ04_00761100 [Trypanosoma grayi]|uniref:hypothetical protein n=1 Tax=Trypanosoma grayi TaxID=71804 RepID=UPI0004F4718D|nr:hypothetical protein DQ04_00761100 [Trypanosoma grayi]KEG13830.1 hypothetical protein DQ04_00761100 [Trypanosoma grayi]